MQDPDLQPLYRTWADRRWPHLAPVQEVRFEQSSHGPLSEVTPDEDYYIEIALKTGDGRWVYKEMWHITALLRDVLSCDRGQR